MANAKKHMERSHRSRNSKTDFTQFEINARYKTGIKEKKSFFQKIKEKLFRKQGK